MTVVDQSAATNLYRIEARIGEGGMGTVYRALDVQLHRRVALKVLNSSEPDLLDRFLREQEITAELDHPGFVRILSIGYMESPEGSRPFFTMPLIGGLTLEQLVLRRRIHGPEGERLRAEFTQTRLLQLAQQICLTLQSAHDKRIIHRDLKPSNVILGPYGEVYVTDLGLAKRLGPRSNETARFETHVMKQLARVEDTDLTKDSLMGTPYYMAPEQSLTPRKVDHRADIFGLGAILYYILTGFRPVYIGAALRRDEWAQRTGEIAHELRRLQVDPDDPPLHPSSGIRPLLEKYHEAVGILADDPYHVFRVTMREGTIVPPRQALVQACPDRVTQDPGEVDPIDDALEAICMKALSKDPEDRYRSCREMGQELQQYIEGRAELILKRRGLELTRHLSKTTTQMALEHYDQAERKLRDILRRHEDLGRMGIEDRLELFDVLLGKARIHEYRGDSDAVLRAAGRAEPLIESTLAVLERQLLQVLISKGAALTVRGDLDEAKATEARARELAVARGHEDLALAAGLFYGLGCVRSFARTGNEADLRCGREALRTARQQAQVLEDAASETRICVALAQLSGHPGDGDPEAGALLEDALRLAGEDPALLSEVRTALGTRELLRGNAAAALGHGLESVRLARDADSHPGLQEGLFLLGQAYHFAGDPLKRVETFRALVGSVGGRRTRVAQEIQRFYEKHQMDLAELS